MKTEPTEALKEIKHCTWTAEDFNIGDGFESHEVVDKDDAINIANIAFREGQSSPKIKQLEWVEYENSINRKSYFAKTPFSPYEVADAGSHYMMYSPNKRLRFASADKAKAAAQADFERRVRECLDLKAQQKQALIDMMRGDEEIGLYDDNPKNHGNER